MSHGDNAREERVAVDPRLTSDDGVNEFAVVVDLLLRHSAQTTKDLNVISRSLAALNDVAMGHGSSTEDIEPRVGVTTGRGGDSDARGKQSRFR